ncbi:hypothetical protein QRX50_31555 [Amycolatopsis carbonis]|uniref:Uncharacterized protein n=1 Tax=Amycolatopsis carbonis TaxID=715471 RepID=A0A9Y2I9H0_9PSEU|nr:hypothetical protein [Amycolatopsis sp. 2-15]WIX75997.1 hypothetical protein QRX50_31555 [Amycolatopsis sp. 2-15]
MTPSPGRIRAHAVAAYVERRHQYRTELEAIVRIASELDVSIARLALWVYSHLKTAN